MARQFPPNEAEGGTSPNYVPQAWAVRYTAPARPVTDWRHTEWRKYGTRHHAELGIKGMQHFPPSERFEQLPDQRRWKRTAMVVELWEYIALSTGGSWHLHETRVYRDGAVLTV